MPRLSLREWIAFAATVMIIVGAVVIYELGLWRSDQRVRMIEGSGRFVAAERRYHRDREGRGSYIRHSDWEEVCGWLTLDGVPNLFVRCFTARDFAAAKFAVGAGSVLRLWVGDPRCPEVTPRSRNDACLIEQLEIDERVIATPDSAPSCSIWHRECPVIERGSAVWQDIKRFPLGVTVGALDAVDGAPRHYLEASDRFGFRGEWVEYRFLGFEGANGSVNIVRARGNPPWPSAEVASLDVRELQDAPFVVRRDRHRVQTTSGVFEGFSFQPLVNGRLRDCFFFAGSLERDEFAVRGWYCAPFGAALLSGQMTAVFESVRVLPPAWERL